MSVTFEPERVVSLEPWGLAPCVVKRLNKREMGELRRTLARANNLKVKAKGKDMAPEMDLCFMDEVYWAQFCLKEAPFPITKEGIESQDAELVDYIAQEAQDINSYFFLRPPEAETEASEGSTSETSSSGPTLNAHVTLAGR
ncbi:MAG: hypothetical protein A4E31_00408 [Methanomassiliicoccales archaeon PtaU1.Bin030]|nr:MAG: hypothetical protein A4E31_00408 [Methanomassiliicoccales archaeon PtaU1.Bin030]